MSNEEVQRLIREQGMRLPNAGIDKWAGWFLQLDEDEVSIDGRPLAIRLYAWLEHDPKGNTSPACCGFIIAIKTQLHEYIYMDHFFEASAVWNYYLQKHRVI